MRGPLQLRIAAVLAAAAALAFATLAAFLVSLGTEGGRLGFGSVDGPGLLQGAAFLVAFTVGLLYARGAMRIPSPTLLSFGVLAPPTAARVAATVPVVNAASGLQTLAEHRVVIVEEEGVPVGVAGVRRERITSWADVVKVDGRVAVTDLRRVLAHEPLVVVTRGDAVIGVVTQEMYLAGLWGRVR